MTWTVGRGAMYDESLQVLVGSCIQARWASVWFMSMTIKITPVRFTMGKFFSMHYFGVHEVLTRQEDGGMVFANIVLLRAKYCQTGYRSHVALCYARNMSTTLYCRKVIIKHQHS